MSLTDIETTEAHVPRAGAPQQRSYHKESFHAPCKQGVALNFITNREMAIQEIDPVQPKRNKTKGLGRSLWALTAITEGDVRFTGQRTE